MTVRSAGDRFVRGTLALAMALVMCGSCTSHASSRAANSRTTMDSTVTTPSTTLQGGGPPIDACTLVSREDASTAFGVDAGQPQYVNAHLDTCEYDVGTSHLLDVSAVRLSNAKAVVNSQNNQPGLQTVPGIGDSAFFNAATGVIQVLEGSTILTLTLRPPPPTSFDAPPPILVALARTAVSRLPVSVGDLTPSTLGTPP